MGGSQLIFPPLSLSLESISTFSGEEKNNAVAQESWEEPGLWGSKISLKSRGIREGQRGGCEVQGSLLAVQKVAGRGPPHPALGS